MEDRRKGLARISEELAEFEMSDDDDDRELPAGLSATFPVGSVPPITQVVARGEKTSAPDDDARFARAWRVWLEALAHDPEAAWAAALTYKSLGIEGREAWIDALEIDAPDVGAPAIALYAPLLGVEDDPGRRERIEAALRKQGVPLPTNVLRALRGEKGDKRVYVIVHPLYLDFVEVLTCFVTGEQGFADVRHDPIIRATQAPSEGDTIDATEIEAVPVEVVVEELAHAVVAHRRRGGVLPPPLVRFADLFTPRPESVDREKLRRA
jgi:hypothetical protein